MASNNLRDVGKYLRQTNRTADLALKKSRKKIPIKDRVRDNISSVFPLTVQVETDEPTTVLMDINFNKPPPDGCGVDCISTVCEDFPLTAGGHSINVTNPYEPDTTRVYIAGEPLETIQWYEEEPTAGKVYVQVQGDSAVVVICYTFITC